MDDGASSGERLLAAARTNNPTLLKDALSSSGDEGAIALVINNTKDAFNNNALHIGARYGNIEILDELLNYEGVECDPRNIYGKQERS